MKAAAPKPTWAKAGVLPQGPGTKVLYTSDHTDEIVHEGHLDSGLALLGKPDRKSDLSQKIREVLAAK